MYTRTFLYFSLLLLLSSCSMNFLFLHPYELTTASEFSSYNEELGDTLKITFTEEKAPEFKYVAGKTFEKDYTIENTFYQNTNRDSINAWIIRPKENYNGTTLFFVHGNAGNLVYQLGLATPFAERGYKVFIFDYSGFGFSQGKSTRKNVLIDGISGFDYLLSLDEFKNENIIIYGQSLGGHLATVIAKEREEKINALVVEGAFSSHKDIAADRAAFLGRIFVSEQYKALDSIPLIEKPVLVIHSVEDKVVPFELGKKLYDAASEPKSFYQLDSCHICGPIYYADSIVARMQRL